MKFYEEYQNDASKIITLKYNDGTEYKHVLSYQEWLENELSVAMEKIKSFVKGKKR